MKQKFDYKFGSKTGQIIISILYTPFYLLLMAITLFFFVMSLDYFGDFFYKINKRISKMLSFVTGVSVEDEEIEIYYKSPTILPQWNRTHFTNCSNIEEVILEESVLFCRIRIVSEVSNIIEEKGYIEREYSSLYFQKKSCRKLKEKIERITVSNNI